jgi:hypothetical protein
VQIVNAALQTSPKLVHAARRRHDVFDRKLRQLYDQFAKLSVFLKQLTNIGFLMLAPRCGVRARALPTRQSNVSHDSLHVEVVRIPEYAVCNDSHGLYMADGTLPARGRYPVHNSIAQKKRLSAVTVVMMPSVR